MLSPACSRKTKIRLLKFCTCGAITILSTPVTDLDNVVLIDKNSRQLKMAKHQFTELVSDGLITSVGQKWRISKAGEMALRRLLAVVDQFQGQHQLMGTKRFVENGVATSRRVNQAESPLARLRFRCQANGKTYLKDGEFQAGERLRSDFTRGQLMPQTSSNWNIIASQGIRSGAGNGSAELSDTAMSARTRMHKALDAAGPEFSGVFWISAVF